MKILSILFLIAVASTLHGASPNILIILVDDLGYADIGVHGCKDIPTPHIDSLARDGATFTQGYAASPVCSPSRAGLLTGVAPYKLGFITNDEVMREGHGIPAETPTLAEILKGQGYATACIGKWHAGHEKENMLPQARGFDVVYGTSMNNRNFRPQPNMMMDSSLAGGILTANDLPPDLFLPEEYGRRATKWINAQSPKQPWFLYLAYNAVHFPVESPDRYVAAFKHISDPKRREMAALVSALDESIGVVLEALSRSGQAENTLVVFTSDNGGDTRHASDNRPLRGWKAESYEGGIRAPFLVRWPNKIRPGETRDVPVTGLDILPTCLSAAEVTSEPSSRIDGMNLLPYLHDASLPAPERFMAWRFGDRRAARIGDHKVVLTPGSSPQLFNLRDDPLEQHDLAEKRSDLLKSISERMKVEPGFMSDLSTPVESAPLKKKAKPVERNASKTTKPADNAKKKAFLGDADTALLSGPQAVAEMTRFRKEQSSDPYRPLYHFSPPCLSLHDPAGLCWWQGKYHLFYLYNTPGSRWGRGHAVSDDLIHWQDMPMLPDTIRGGTGQVWADKDRAIIGYAAPTHGEASVATSSDPELRYWTPHPNNPVLKPGNDNYIWREGDEYFLTFREHEFAPDLQYLSGRTTLRITRSSDLMNWQPATTLIEDGFYTEPGEDFGCNNVLPIGSDKHLILFFSHKRAAQYYVGRMLPDRSRFDIESHGRMNYGPVMRGSLHAPSGFVDPSGRCIGIWNVIENRPSKAWNEVMSLPRHLGLNDKENGAAINPLTIQPLKEMESLRFSPALIQDQKILANTEVPLPGIKGKAIEIEAIIDPMQAREVGLNLLRSDGAEEQVTLTFHRQGWARMPGSSEITLDVSRASLAPDVNARSPETGPLYLGRGEKLHLRIFIDRSIIEVFANGRQCLTLRVYPTRPDSVGVSCFARGGEARLVELQAWQMRSIWPELKATESQ